MVKNFALLHFSLPRYFIACFPVFNPPAGGSEDVKIYFVPQVEQLIGFD
jgi:hypothetical protein